MAVALAHRRQAGRGGDPAPVSRRARRAPGGRASSPTALTTPAVDALAGPGGDPHHHAPARRRARAWRPWTTASPGRSPWRASTPIRRRVGRAQPRLPHDGRPGRSRPSPAQWSLPTIGAPSGWDLTTGGAPGVRIAVIDSGVDLTHPDLVPNLTGANPGETGCGRETNRRDDDGNGKVDDWRGWDFVNNDNTPQDDTPGGHGTHVAGIIAARGNNDLGVAGIAWRAQLIPVKAIDDRATAPSSTSRRRSPTPPSAARGSPTPASADPAVEPIASAIAQAPDTLFVVAAGNGGTDGVGDDNDDDPIFPCNLTLPNVICVTATGRTDQLASFANIGPNIGRPGRARRGHPQHRARGRLHLRLGHLLLGADGHRRGGAGAGGEPGRHDRSSCATRSWAACSRCPRSTGRVTTGGRLSLPGALGLTPARPQPAAASHPAAARARRPRRPDPPAGRSRRPRRPIGGDPPLRGGGSSPSGSASPRRPARCWNGAGPRSDDAPRGTWWSPDVRT